MKTKILFFDQTLNQLLRIGDVISAEIQRITNGESETFGLVYDTAKSYTNPAEFKHTFSNIVVTKSIRKVERFIKTVSPDMVVLATNTIPNQAVILFAKRIGAKVIMLQHGILYDGAHLNNVRIGEIFAALKEFGKTVGYFNILRYMCWSEHRSFLRLLFNMVKNRTNVTVTTQDFFNVPLRGDKAFVIGEHWVDFYHEKYGYDKSDIIIMGNHDLDGLDEDRPCENAICYIPSVHVEDGHVAENIFVDFLQAMGSAIPQDMKLYMKLHPRSNVDMYKKHIHHPNVEYIIRGELPYTEIYIGHNSTLLTRALHITGKVILWHFREEPELFYEKQALAVCNDKASLQQAVEKAIQMDNCPKSDIAKYSSINPVGAYEFCAKKIVESVTTKE